MSIKKRKVVESMSKRKIIYMIITMLLSVGCFISYGDVKASGESVSESRTDENNEITFDCVWFGRYPQTDKTGRIYDPIKWRVLSISGDDMFLMTDNTLDCKVMNQQAEDKEEYELDLRWENCDMRTWLNSDFYKKAFNKLEQNSIIETKVKTKLSTNSALYSSKKKAITTKDKVYLLSLDEAENKKYGIFTAAKPLFKNTSYVKNKKAETTNYGNGTWWLRSSGYVTNEFDTVNGYGNSGAEVCIEKGITICPVIHIKKSSVAWIYAGTVCSDGTVNEVNKPASITKAGWIKKNGVYTYLDKKNNPVTKNKGWYKIDDKYYYLDATGNRITKNAGWYKINGKYYYLRKSGVRVTKNKGWHKINGKYYYLKKSGERVKKSKGWYKVGDRYRYLKGDGTPVKKTGWGKVGKKYYYINKNGQAELKTPDYYKIGKKYYYIDVNGNRIKKKAGWIYSDRYINADGSYYTGWKTIKGKKYYFDKTGRLKGEVVKYSFKNNEGLYTFVWKGKRYYQSISLGVLPEKKTIDFTKAMQKYPDGSIFDGIGNKNANQCNVFTYAVGKLISGVYPDGGWKKVYKYDMNKIKAGDIIKYRHTDGSVHYVIVMEVYGDFIKCADANGGGIKNQVSWGWWTAKSYYWGYSESDYKNELVYVLIKP